MVSISILRRGATKRLSLSTTRSDYLAICQILESTSDVTNYCIAELNPRNYSYSDMYLPESPAFPKWIPMSAAVQESK